MGTANRILGLILIRVCMCAVCVRQAEEEETEDIDFSGQESEAWTLKTRKGRTTEREVRVPSAVGPLCPAAH